MNQMRELIKPMTDDDYKKLMSDVGMPDSRSLLIALQQVANHTAQYTLQQAARAVSVPVVGDVDCYDAGLLSDFGGGNVEWWQDYIRAELARAHEFYASQSAPEVVPIVGKTVGYLAGGTLMRRKIQGYDCKPLIVQPATSISAAELDALRKDAERWRMTEKCRYVTVEAIDAAIAGEKK